MTKVAVVAGGGNLPLEFIKRAKEKGVEVVIISITGEKLGPEQHLGFKVYNIGIGQLGKIVTICRAEKTKYLMFLGYISHIHVIKNLKVDLRTLTALMKLKDKKAASLLGGAVKEFKKEGISVIPSTFLMEKMLAAKGQIAGRAQDKKTAADCALGFRMARELARLDIGQTVVVKNGVIVAAEAQEGTDACIRRGAEIGGRGFIVAKAARPDQDTRYDVPVIGLRTMELIKKLGGKGMVVQAGMTFLLDKAELIKYSNSRNMFIIGK
jgi:UDP-2,3-diacylglucosamine hydrolase